MQPEFDVIVVGAGPGGAACALTLARSGADVLIVEKAKIPGERNMTGGVIYGGFMGHYGLINLVPEFESQAPVQRRIVSHEVDVLADPDWEKGEYRYYRLGRDSIPSRIGLFNVELETGHDYSVLRRDFDQWFAAKAVEGGAMLSTQTTAEELLLEGGVVTGIRTPSEELRAKLVIDCSGVTTNLVEVAGLRPKLVPREVYHGVKHIYRLDTALIEQRFKVQKDQGRAILCLGKFMMGVSGGAFIYTNKNTLSVGLVVSMDSLVRALTERFEKVGKVLDVLEAFEGHPMVAELLDGAELLEYSAHNIPKGYKSILRKPYADGYLVAGDALGSFVKIGPLIDGMRRAIASGIMAAETYIQANESGSFKASNLSQYREKLAPIYEDVNRSGRDSFFSESSFVYHALPGFLFSSSLFSKKAKITTPRQQISEKDAVHRVQLRTSLLDYDEDEAYSHIKVNIALASRSATKPWIPCCPVNCYSLVTPKGVFVSYKDLYDYNLRSLEGSGGAHTGTRGDAHRTTRREIEAGEVRFDHVACVACGTCGEIGPQEMVSFGPERDGHGVRYRFG